MSEGTMSKPIVWTPSAERAASSNLGRFLEAHGLGDYDSLLLRAERDPEWWWRSVVDRIAFYRPYGDVLNLDDGPEFARWCDGGTTNICLNALDRHRGTPVWGAPAILNEAESGVLRSWSYAELDQQTCRLASGLRSLGIGVGDVVAVYMPNVAEAVAAMLAVAKIGAIAMPLFSGFGVDALASRLGDSGAVAILTADGTSRRGRPSPMKSVVDAAAPGLPALRHVVVLRQAGLDIVLVPGRDHDWQELCAGQPDEAPTEEMEAEAPCLLIYTSGTTGRPKGTVHTHAGFAAKLALDVGLLMDVGPNDRVLWMSDMGWLVGPILAYGIPILGASFVLADGAPDFPDASRLWRLVEEHRVTVFGLAPTLVRSFMRGDGTGNRDLSSIRLCVSSGEAWTPDAWSWTFEHVCRGDAPIINYSGGTEIGGGILTGTVIHPMKACAFSGPIPGMGADIVDETGHPVPTGTVGELVLRSPSIGLSRGLWNDRERYLDSYWRDIPGVWRQGDWALRDEDGFWYILGRSDDTLKIAGKRVGPSEIEAVLTATRKVTEAAVIGIPDPVKGESVGCVVMLASGLVMDAALERELSSAVVSGLGHPFRPNFVIAVDDLPRTRNMKIMRRIVRAACLSGSLGDTSSLVNPEAVAAVQRAAAPLNLAAARVVS